MKLTNKFPEGTRCLVVNVLNKEHLVGRKVTIGGWSVADQAYIITIDGEEFQRKCKQECLKLLEYPLYIKDWLVQKMLQLEAPNPTIAAQLVQERRDGIF